MDFKTIKAFDYHPAFSTMLIDHWRRFDEYAIRAELLARKELNPEWNAIRITHSYDAYLRDTVLYLSRYERLLEICSSLGLGVISCLFNRWHDSKMDCGGIYLEYLIPGLSWSYKEGFYAQFVADVCTRYAHDARIILWETCNKPFGTYRDFSQDHIDSYLYEKRWVRELYCYVKKAEVMQPVGLSVQEWYDERVMVQAEHSCDVLIRSPYYMNSERTAAIMACPFGNATKPMITIQE